MKTQHHITEEEFERIQNWILGNMSSAEAEGFREQMAGDKVLKEKVKEVRVLLIGIQEASLEKKLAAFNPLLLQEVQIPARRFRMINLQKWWAAAVIFLMASISAYLFFNATSENEKLFSRYYHPDPGLLSAMSITGNYEFERAMIDYKTGNYRTARVSWENLLEQNPGNDTLQYFIASAHMAEKHYPQALSFFNLVLKNNHSVFYQEASWFKGLILIHQNKPLEAEPFIQQSAQPEKEEVLKKINPLK